MPISVAKESRSETLFFSELENCCFCRKPTPFWVAPVTGDSPACCEACAAQHEPQDLPTKNAWIAKEREIAAAGHRSLQNQERLSPETVNICAQVRGMTRDQFQARAEKAYDELVAWGQKGGDVRARGNALGLAHSVDITPRLGQTQSQNLYFATEDADLLCPLVIQQERPYYCGPACLAILEREFMSIVHRTRSQELWAEIMGTTAKRGTSCAGLKRGLRVLGLEHEVVRYRPPNPSPTPVGGNLALLPGCRGIVYDQGRDHWQVFYVGHNPGLHSLPERIVYVLDPEDGLALVYGWEQFRSKFLDSRRRSYALRVWLKSDTASAPTRIWDPAPFQNLGLLARR